MSDAAPPAAVVPRSHGQWAVVAMLVLAVILAAFGWWWNFDRGRRTLELYGPEGATLIRTAPKVELVGDSGGNIDISKAPGLLNARTSLLNDASYEWSASATAVEGSKHSVRFSRGDQSIDVIFDFENRSIRTSPQGSSARLKTKTAEGWRNYLERQAKAK